MSTKAKSHAQSDNGAYDTSRYLGQLNQIYNKYGQSTSESWDQLDEELKYELVIKSLFVVKELDGSPVEDIKGNLQMVLSRGDEFTTHVLRFMQDQELVTEKKGKIHLTEEGKEILE